MKIMRDQCKSPALSPTGIPNCVPWIGERRFQHHPVSSSCTQKNISDRALYYVAKGGASHG